MVRISLWLLLFVACAFIFVVYLRYGGTFLYTLLDFEGIDARLGSEKSFTTKRPSHFCFTLTSTSMHDSRVPAQNDTWIWRCDDHYFFSDSPMKTGFKNLVVHNYSDYLSSWKKMRAVLPHVYANVSEEHDWYLKADDDTYVVVENLRHFLSKFDPNQMHYFGFHMKPHVPFVPPTGYATGSAIVFSRAVLKLLTERLIPDLKICPIEAHDDIAIARCFAAINVTPGYTRDHMDRERFHPFNPSRMYQGPTDRLLVTYSGFDAFSEEMICSHHLSPMEMRLFDILLYRVKVHGEK